MTHPVPALHDKMCLVTGANAGIGKATAIGLAIMGATVFMACRNRERGEAALAEIRHTSGNNRVYLLLADLSSHESIRRLATEFKSRYATLHILVNNAAIIPQERKLTIDGLETQFAVNHLAPFLLTNLLLDVLLESAPSRIVTVSSQVHSRSSLDFGDLQSEKRYTPGAAYRKMKLANVLFTYELARQLKGTGVTANCLHPGVITTRLLNDYMEASSQAGHTYEEMGEDPTKAAEAILHVATSSDLEGINGMYFHSGRPAESSPASYDKKAASRLWEISAELTGLASPTMQL